MLVFFGIIITVIMVFGAYILGGGNISVILHALPMELSVIIGASTGAFLVANSPIVIKKFFSDIGLAFRGPRWQKDDYIDILTLMYDLIKYVRVNGMLAIERHLEDPTSSSLFASYPRILANKTVIDLICDVFRVVSLNLDDVMQIEELIDKRLRKIEHELLSFAHALQVVADGLPAIGIVAAVLGVIKTMANVDQPPAVLGMMIGGALVGTFLGVFLAYCLAGPFASKIQAIYKHDMHLYLVVKDIIVSYLHRNPPQIAVEVGRGNVPSEYQPSFAELEHELQKERSGVGG